ncbi:MAG TPA: hypothetical protein VGL65_05675 [Gemmatimonadales bacterium]
MPRPDPGFQRPGSPRTRWWPWLLAVAVLVALGIFLMRRPDLPPVIAQGSPGISPDDKANEMLLPAQDPPPPPRRAARTPVRIPPASSLVATVDSRSATSPPVVATSPVDTPKRIGTIGPRYGDGRLWVEPLPESPRKIASILTGKSAKELTDSAVTAMVQTYLDEMVKERPENTAALPSWTTTVAGKKVGVDQKWIYLGPLKIPTALLALLPIKMQANPTEWEMNAKLQQMRSDLFEAARRAENYQEFKESVKELHEQTERAREFKRNQATPPPADTSHDE